MSFPVTETLRYLGIQVLSEYTRSFYTVTEENVCIVCGTNCLILKTNKQTKTFIALLLCVLVIIINATLKHEDFLK